MNGRLVRAHACGAALGGLILGGFLAASSPAQTPAEDWQRTFNVTASDLATTGESPYLILKPGYQLTLEGKEYKLYAPGVGLVQDGSLVLVSYTKR